MPSLPTSLAQRLLSTQATGSSIPSVCLHCPHWHCACLRQARSNAHTGSPRRFTRNEALHIAPVRGSSGRPYGAGYFIFPPTTRVVPSVPPVGRLLVSPLPPSPSLRFPAFRFRSLCSLHLHSGRLRSSPPESRRGSLDAPRRVSPSLTLRASRPPSNGSFSLFFLVYLYWFVCVIGCCSKRHPCHPRNPWFHSFVSIRVHSWFHPIVNRAKTARLDPAGTRARAARLKSVVLFQSTIVNRQSSIQNGLENSELCYKKKNPARYFRIRDASLFRLLFFHYFNPSGVFDPCPLKLQRRGHFRTFAA